MNLKDISTLKSNRQALLLMNSEYEKVKLQIIHLTFSLITAGLCLLVVGFLLVRAMLEHQKQITSLAKEIADIKDHTQKELAYENSAKLALSQKNWYYLATQEKNVAVVTSEPEGKGFRLKFDLPEGYWDFAQYPVADSKRTNLKGTMFPEVEDKLVGKQVSFSFPYYRNVFTVFNDRLQMNIASLPPRPGGH